MAFGPVSIGGSSYVLPPATKESLGGVIVGDDLTVDEQGKINLPVATATTLGGIKSGKGLEIRADGTASIDAYNTAETDALLDELQKQMDGKISAATSIAASGNNYVRFTDGTQICWCGLGGAAWTSFYYQNSQVSCFNFPVPFIDKNYGVGFILGSSISSGSNVSCDAIYNASTNTTLVMHRDYDGSAVVIGRWK